MWQGSLIYLPLKSVYNIQLSISFTTCKDADPGTLPHLKIKLLVAKVKDFQQVTIVEKNLDVTE